jgi:repressor LexA
VAFYVKVNNSKELGLLLKQARKMKSDKEGQKVTQDDFAEMIGISRGYLADMETGRTEPSLAILNKIADLCGLSLDFFQISSGSRSSIPVLGTIRAGEPIDAVENVVGYIDMPVRGQSSEYFGLTVRGDSMDLCHINDGDVVIIRQQDDVENGEIAAVIIDDERATLKKIYRNGTYVSLNPCSSNPAHQPLIIDPNITQLRILGRVVKAVINF